MAQLSNIVRLPTAAKRKVQQPCNRASRVEMTRLRAATAWPGAHPSERAMERAFATYQEQQEQRLTKLDAIQDRATLAIVVALFDSLKQPERIETFVRLRTRYTVSGSASAADGYDVLKLLTSHEEHRNTIRDLRERGEITDATTFAEIVK